MKRQIQKILRRFGINVVRCTPNQLGIDPFDDINHFLGGNDQPMILDVGGNVGQSVNQFKSRFPKSIIHSFEPSPQTHLQLKSNCSHFSNVKVWNTGVGSSDSTLPLMENSHNDMSSFLAPGEFCWGTITKTSEVPVTTLDSFAARHDIDFIHVLKSDTQGFELEVFKGASRLMKEDRIGMIYFELIFSAMYQNLPPYYSILEFLHSHGFSLVNFYTFNHQNSEASWTDALFVNRQYLKDFLKQQQS
jgi:FkbM family methyltransferase